MPVTEHSTILDSPNPDTRPAYSKLFKDELDSDTIRYIFQVRGLGAMIVYCKRSDRSIKLCTFSSQEVGCDL